MYGLLILNARDGLKYKNAVSRAMLSESNLLLFLFSLLFSWPCNKMTTLSLQVLALLALSFFRVISAAPIDGLTKRAPGVVGLDFDYVVKKTNGTIKSNKRRGESPSSTLVNEASYYITYIDIGSNNQKIGVDIDTGSSDLWVPSSSLVGSSATQYGSYDFSSSSTFSNTGSLFFIAYGDYSTTQGVYVTDSVNFSGDNLKNFQFGLAFQTSVTTSGILGIGLESLEASIGFSGEYTNFPVALKNAGYIDTVQYSLYLNAPEAASGSIIFGGKDLAKIDGELVTLPHSGDPTRLDVTLDSISVAGQNIQVNTPVNLDSGTTFTYLSDDVYNAFVAALGGDGSINPAGQYPIVNCQTSGNLTYNFNGISIDVPLTDIVNEFAFGLCEASFLGGGDNILGDSFLRYAYLVYDLENSAISIAKVKYTSETNIVAI